MPKLRLLASTLVLALAGCGGGTSTDKACTDLAAARCAQRASCTNMTSVTHVYGDMNSCLTREKLNCTNAMAAKATGATPDRAEQCVTALANESCSDYFAGNTPAACVNMGTLTDGTACAFAGQCSSTYCTNLANAACGTCGQPVGSGGDCSNGATCARGLLCVTTPGSMGMAMSCQAEGTQGASCSRAMPCAAGFNCVGSTGGAMGMPGTCMAAVATAGAACDPTLKTGPACDRAKGLFCNATSKTCTAVNYAAAGASCGLGSDGNYTDCAAGLCYGASGTTMGTCKGDAPDGAACDTANGPGCIAPAKCVTASGSTSGTCTLPDATKC